MAIQNLNSEFQALAQVLSDKVMRTAATQQSNDMKFDYTRMIRGLMTHYFGSESGGTAGPVIGRTKGSKEIKPEFLKEAEVTAQTPKSTETPNKKTSKKNQL